MSKLLQATFEALSAKESSPITGNAKLLGASTGPVEDVGQAQREHERESAVSSETYAVRPPISVSRGSSGGSDSVTAHNHAEECFPNPTRLVSAGWRLPVLGWLQAGLRSLL
jgi:hypothetical protein